MCPHWLEKQDRQKTKALWSLESDTHPYLMATEPREKIHKLFYHRTGLLVVGLVLSSAMASGAVVISYSENPDFLNLMLVWRWWWCVNVERFCVSLGPSKHGDC